MNARALNHVREREGADVALFISLDDCTKGMIKDAASTGFYEHKLNRQKYPRLQLRTVKELMDGKGIERPSNVAALDETFKKAPQSKKNRRNKNHWSCESPSVRKSKATEVDFQSKVES